MISAIVSLLLASAVNAFPTVGGLMCTGQLHDNSLTVTDFNGKTAVYNDIKDAKVFLQVKFPSKDASSKVTFGKVGRDPRTSYQVMDAAHPDGKENGHYFYNDSRVDDGNMNEAIGEKVTSWDMTKGGKTKRTDWLVEDQAFIYTTLLATDEQNVQWLDIKQEETFEASGAQIVGGLCVDADNDNHE